jgi:hypothetical protein
MNRCSLAVTLCMALAGVILYAAKVCVVNIDVGCLYPPRGGPQTGTGLCPRCSNTNTIHSVLSNAA